MKTLQDIKHVLVLGSGTLGLRVALACALNDYNVTVYDIKEKAFEQALRIQNELIGQLVKSERISKEIAEQALKNQIFTTNAQEAATHADLVSESVTEDLELKKKVWAEFGELCPKHTIFTTNTSYLIPSLFAQETGRPNLFCALHFHDVFYANVVDIMPNPQTEDWIIPLLKEFGQSIQQTPVIIRRESPGYIFNAMLMALIGAAGALVTFDVSSIEDVDRSWMGNFKMHMGPFGILDEIGLDTAWHVTSNLKDEKSKRFSKLLKHHVDQGKLGKKVGEGFYSYPNPRFQEEGFING
ncbi:MAG: 3-hydroxyacyl-CoA dehydrogenase NAD-binding domain-containing protein [Flavobacteriaceae bacterium]|nr:3-hydroxyacyl-CoA dehydrogenase NAD-binding domain-containing protein [Flavobacteriaceae bacterium]